MKIKSIVFAVLCMLLLTGCSENNVTIDVVKLADELKNTIQFSDSMEEMSDTAFGLKYEIDEADLTAKKVYIGSGATAEEIAVFEAKDEAAAARILSAVNLHVEEQIHEYTNYNPNELTKLNDAIKMQKGKYVILCVSDHSEAVKSLINTYTK
jgi:hypothetical protein